MLTCIWALEFSPQMFFRGKLSVFPPIFKYHNVFQNHSEDYIGNDDIIDINEVHCTLFFEFTVCYIVFKELYHRKYC